MLQETKYTALCSISIGFYSIESEQTAYRYILSFQPRSHPTLLYTCFMIKKIGTLTKFEQDPSSTWTRWAEYRNQENEKRNDWSRMHNWNSALLCPPTYPTQSMNKIKKTQVLLISDMYFFISHNLIWHWYNFLVPITRLRITIWGTVFTEWFLIILSSRHPRKQN